nr:Glycerol kinase [Ipomoea batatas]GME21107.1 Glycerol kinase [Ipomoea batatas]
MKRKSPESLSSGGRHHHRGFKILPLPITFPSPSSTLSHPFNSASRPLSPETTNSSSPANPLPTSFHVSGPSAVAFGIQQDSPSSKNETEINGGDNEEAVSVEKRGNRIAIHLKCPCGKSHRILQAGNNFYYNLI